MNDNDKHAEAFDRLNRELVYKAKIFDVFQDTLKTPAGNIVKWDHIGHRGAAAVIPVTERGTLLMVRQFRNSVDRLTLEIPAGGREYEEEPTELCAKRELEEETGYKSDDLEYLFSVNTEIAFCDEQIDVYVARNLKPSMRHLDADEFIDIEEWAVEDLVDLIYKGEIKDSKTVSAILAYKNKYC